MIDPAKLKVVELRAELAKRGLDQKGVKAALVKRLKEALEEELKEELPDTSIADTSTEDLDKSLVEEKDEPQSPAKESEEVKSEKEPEAEPAPADIQEPEKEEEEEVKEDELLKEEEEEEQKPEDEQKPEEETKENGEQESSPLDQEEVVPEELPPDEVPRDEAKTEDVTPAEKDTEMEVEPKGGEKRRRTSTSPERPQRRRSKSPIREDEPPIDNDKVQLSWYDSDLHLQLDKESFLSAKPYHDGAFGFAWAGVRATHGINAGKVCFEVKITEELTLEDISKYGDRQKLEKKSEDAPKKDESPESKPDEPMDTKEEEPNEDSKENGSEKSTETPEDPEPTEEKKEEPETVVPEVPESVEEARPKHMFRVGWSLLDTDLQLGEDKFSFGFESSGRFVNAKTFQEYGVSFGVGDVISSFLDIKEDTVSFSYAVNGESQAEALSVEKVSLPENFSFFPHILSQNYAFELNLGAKEAWFPKPEQFQDFEYLEKIDNKISGPVRPENRTDCEVILMCGLPASGKTYWTNEHLEANPNTKYTVLGNAQLLNKMTVSCDPLKSKFKRNWSLLLDKLQKCLNKLVETAALRRRNYIIDQTNVFPSAQRRKLRTFEGFKRRAIVVVLGDEEQTKRQSLQEAQDGKEVADNTILEMKANMTLPMKSDWDEVIYAGVPEDEAKAIVQKYNTQGRDAGYGVHRRFGHRDDRNRWQNRRHDYRGGNYRERNYHSRYDRGPPRQNWHQRSGGWNRDRRDRGPPMGGSRDWRNRGNGRERGNRDSSQGNSYNRNRSSQNRSSSGGGGNWQQSWSQNQGGGNSGASGWGGSGGQQWGNSGGWGQSWSQANQNQWKYGGGSSNQNYGNYSNWGYYGQYPQQWGQQGQTASAQGQYGQYSQQEWAQYAQQYAQQGQTPTVPQSTTQK